MELLQQVTAIHYLTDIFSNILKCPHSLHLFSGYFTVLSIFPQLTSAGISCIFLGDSCHEI